MAGVLLAGCQKQTPGTSSTNTVAGATNAASAISGAGGSLISGRVIFNGTLPEPRTLALDALCGKLVSNPVTESDYIVGESNGLEEVFVYLKDLPQGRGTTPAGETPVLDQQGCIYTPRVIGVVVNQKFRIRNSDPLLHNVHAKPKDNKEFNFAQPIQGQINDKTFAQPEVLVPIRCDVHPWMKAYVGVVAHQFFAITGPGGKFRLPAGVPPGKYTLETVHFKGGTASQEVTIAEGEHKQVELTITPQK